jgi:hypothetical protein
MADLTKFRNKTLDAINSPTVEKGLRPYLGMSKIAHSCDRFLWYGFRWCFTEEIGRRNQRLFDRGHREEPEVYKELNRIGIRCWGDQDGITLAHGHGKGHRDGVCIGVLEAPKTEHLLEIKTMNKKNFTKLKKDGSVKVSKPVYYGQAQIYMRKFKLTRALFIAVCKDNDEWYIERIKLDKGYADDLERRAEMIVLSEAPPSKQFKPTWWECKFCSAKMICHYDREPETNCRTCQSCDLLPDGKWGCSRIGIELSTDQQRLGCKGYDKLESL